MMLQSITNSWFSQLAAQSPASKSMPRSAATAAIDLEILEIEVTATEEVREPTVADVKKEFYDYLDSLPLSPGLSNTSISVNITEAAFERMLGDPEYKQRMKDLCARDLCDPDWVKLPPAATVIAIDTDCEEEYLGSAYSSEQHRGMANSDGFWTRRAKTKKAERKDEEKRAREKRELMEFLQERADERKRLLKNPFDTSPGWSATAHGSSVFSDI